MQFRNAFDSQGPSIPGIDPLEAMSRLDDFQKRYDIYEAKRQTIDSVSKLFSIPCKPFLELDRTGEVGRSKTINDPFLFLLLILGLVPLRFTLIYTMQLRNINEFLRQNQNSNSL